MSTRSRILLFGLPFLLLGLTACAGLTIPEGEEDQPQQTAFGPQITSTEHQTIVFEEILERLKENYVYYKSSGKNWTALREKYLGEIEKGLTTEEFNQLMDSFESEFAEGEVIYVPREERIKVITEGTRLGEGGIGAFISFQAEEVPHVVILDVMPESPAEKSGLRPHDSILAVDGEAITLEEGGDVIQRIRGKTGTTVSLTVQTPGDEEREIQITRAALTGTSQVKASELPDLNIGYILLPTSASTNSVNEITEALDTFSKNSDLKGVIIDLRIAANGTEWPIEDMLTLFISDMTIDVYSQSKNELFSIKGEDFAGSLNVPLVVLVGEHTSGLPELFAAAVQSTGRGTVIGSNTQGNIEAVNGFPLTNGGQISIASASFRVSSEEEIGLNGFSPEVQIDAQWDEIQAEDDPVLEKAIQSFEVTE